MRKSFERRGSSVDHVYDVLRQRIVSLEFLPNHSLSRQELANELGVSQTPLREALQRLQGEGLVEIYPQSRTLVTRIDVSRVAEAVFLRTAVETEIVARLAADTTIYDISLATGIHRLLLEAVGREGDFETFASIDKEFHRALYEAAGLARLHELVDTRSGQLDRIRHLHLRHKSERKPEMVVADHARILDAIRAGDPVGAKRAMHDHLSGTLSRLEILRERYPDWFD